MSFLQSLAITLLIHHCSGIPEQRFDGFFNNLGLPSLGSAGRHLQQNITPTFSDFTYRVVDRGYPSARDVSQALFRKPTNQSSTPNHRNLTAFFAFFGQVVTFELLDTDDTTCPVELLKIPVPKCDEDFDAHCTGDQHLPYERIAYDKNTGQSPNVPRKQVNKATSYIDGSFVYGNQALRALYLKEVKSSKMASGDGWYKYPERNKDGLPFVMSPDPVEHKFRDYLSFWKLGDKHVQENPALLSLGVLFFRYHNFLSETLPFSGKRDSHEMFNLVRHWVIATLQNIIVYEWLPALTGKSLPPYTGYDSSVNPDVTSVFDAAAIRYILTLIPAGIHQRTIKCEQIFRYMGDAEQGQRLCNSFWKSQEILERREDAVEEMILGMITQLAEADDTYIVEDLQSKFYGPLHFSRHDFVSQTIMRGRDYGLSDYNTVREQMGLGRITDWGQINPSLNRTHPELIEKLQDVYGRLDVIDVFVGGMFETTEDGGPGELFSAVLIDQFARIRDGDRFWFENKNNGLFTQKEIEQIKSITMISVILNATKLEVEYVGNRNAFVFSQDDGENDRCNTSTYLYEDILESCTPHKGYDYFAGSEGAYIVLWISFGLIPFLCLLVAFVLSKCKRLRHNRNVKRAQRNITEHIGGETQDQLEPGSDSVIQHKAVEWIETKESRPIVVRIKYDYKLEILSLRGKILRWISLISLKHVHLSLSSNKNRNLCLVKVPKEYDVILQFTNEEHRRQFVDALKYVLNGGGCSLDVTEMKMKYIFKNAFTRRKRNQLLERFFKTVFAEAFQMDYDPTLDAGEVETRQNAELLEIELTKEEFASALAMKPNSEFVENMFALMDVDHNGYISFREFLNAIVMLSKGSGENKLQTLFRMFDLDHSGTLDKDELFKLFSSLLEMANSALTKPEIENLVESICQQQGITSDDAIDFEQFCTILSPHTDKLWNAGLEWKGCKNYIPAGEERKKSVSNLRRLSSVITNMFNAEARKRTAAGQGERGSDSSMASIINSENSSLEMGGTERKHRFMAIRESYSPLKAKMRRIKHFIENNRQHIFYLLIFFGICAAVFAERFYYYFVEREHSGLRAMMSYGISFTRGASAGMAFSYSLLLLTMLRNTITFLRGTFLNLYVPFDSIVSFHKIVAWTALFFTAVHVIGYGFNFYNLAMQPTKYLCVFDTVVFRADMLPSLNFWFFQNATGVTGILLVIVVYIIYIFATQTSRRLIFSAFWLSHKLIAVLYVLIFLHGASMIVQKPLFYGYFVAPAVLFIIDKMVSLSRKRVEIKIVRAENLASDVTFIEFKRPPRFEYKSGQWVRIACVGLGGNEYHPFTLTSAPHEDTLSVHIRAVGPWTHGLRNVFDHEHLKEGPYPMLFLDGPYGAGQQDWYTYDVSILVGAGIGVTPYASILKDFVHMTTIKSTYKIRCQKVYFIWVTGSQRHFEWLLDILQEVEEIDEKGMVAIDIFITKFFQNFDLRTAMLYVCEEHFQKLNGGRSVFTSLKANTHFGRPHLSSMFQTVHKAHPMSKKIGVFSCGPPGLTKSVERASVESSRTTKALFEHHYENF